MIRNASASLHQVEIRRDRVGIHVRDQAYIYSRETFAEAMQAKVLTRTRRGGSLPTSRGCRSY